MDSLPSFELMTAKVIAEEKGNKLLHFPARKHEYFQKDAYGSVSYFGKFKNNRFARVSWRADLRSRGVIV